MPVALSRDFICNRVDEYKSGMGLTVFIVYNICGIRENGFVNYMKHFMGPVWWLAPLFFVIELVGHAVRPVSLSLRLYGNIFVITW